MTESLDAIIYALSHAAFGAIALMAIGSLIVLAGKLEERNLSAEVATQPAKAAELMVGDAPPFIYVYNNNDASRLSRRIDAMLRIRLTFAYATCLVIAFLIHSAALRDFVGIEDLTFVKNLAALLGLPDSLMAPFGFTAFVVIDLWRVARRYLKLLRRDRA